MGNENLIKIKDLIGNFRKALVSLVPCAEKINLPWKECEAYDQWDNVASVLFNNFVKFPISWALIKREESNLMIPNYDTLYENYTDFSFITYLSGYNTKVTYPVFHSFVTRKALFDTVRFIKFDNNGKNTHGMFLEVPFMDTEFAFCYQDTNGKLDIYTEISIKEVE